MSDLREVSRKLVAVFAADVAGYSRLMGTDEVGTFKGLTERRVILDGVIGDHRGRIANTARDSESPDAIRFIADMVGLVAGSTRSRLTLAA
jgi:class 3 adenylate cyclase